MKVTCFLECLAPEWVGLGRARAALFMDMDEICKFATFLLWISVWSIIVGIKCYSVIFTLWCLWFICIFKNLFFKDDNYGAEEVENLKTLVSSLRQLLDLHRKYNCRLSLSVFEKVCLLLLMYL